MAVNAIFVREGQTINYTPATAVLAGAIVLLGDLIGVAKMPIAAGAVGALCLSGQFKVIKDGTTGPVFAVGDAVHWDSVNGLAVRGGLAGSGIVYLGMCVAAAGTDEALVEVELAPAQMPAAFQGKSWEDVSISGGSKTLDAEDVGKVINITAGHASNVVTLPATAIGLNFIIRAGVSAGRIAVSPQAADKIMGADLAGTDNKDRILTGATGLMGDYVSLRAEGTNGYYIDAERGIWTNE